MLSEVVRHLSQCSHPNYVTSLSGGLGGGDSLLGSLGGELGVAAELGRSVKRVETVEESSTKAHLGVDTLKRLVALGLNALDAVAVR